MWGTEQLNTAATYGHLHVLIVHVGAEQYLRDMDSKGVMSLTTSK